MKHLTYNVFCGPRASGIDGKRTSVFSTDVDLHLTNFSKEKKPMPAVSSPFEFTKCRRFFSRFVKSTFRNKNVGRKRQDKAGKDKIINLFLETGKSAVEF